MESTWKTIADAWHDEAEAAPPSVSGRDIDALAVYLFGEPSPRGRRVVDVARLRAVAGDQIDLDTRILEENKGTLLAGDAVAAAQWAVQLFA